MNDIKEISKKQERIVELEKARRGEGFLCANKLKVKDFWLLLEHSQEFKELIKNIINGTHCPNSLNAEETPETTKNDSESTLGKLNNNEINALKDSNDLLTKQLQQALEKHANDQATIADLGKQISVLNTFKDSLEEQLQKARDEHDKAQATVKDLGKQIIALNASKHSLEEQLQQARNEHANDQATVEDLGQQITALNASKHSLEEQLQREQTEHANDQATIADLDQQITALNAFKHSLEEQLQREQTEHAETKKEVNRLRSNLNDLNNDKNSLDKKLKQEQQAHQTTQAKADKYERDLENREVLVSSLTSKNSQLETQLATERYNLQSAHAEIKGIGGNELQYLRKDQKLASKLQLNDLSDNNAEALVQVVAVLSQKDRLESLWSFFKDRCEEENRAINQEELSILKSAVRWLNFNWPTKPYSVESISKGQPFDFNNHLRSRRTATGDTIQEVYLPSILDNSGRAIHKAVVLTKN